MPKAVKEQPMPSLLTVKEVMDALRLSRRAVESLIHNGDLETRRLGKNGRWIRVTRESFDRYFASLS